LFVAPHEIVALVRAEQLKSLEFAHVRFDGWFRGGHCERCVGRRHCPAIDRPMIVSHRPPFCVVDGSLGIFYRDSKCVRDRGYFSQSTLPVASAANESYRPTNGAPRPQVHVQTIGF
jgi:hypothetical protein